MQAFSQVEGVHSTMALIFAAGVAFVGCAHLRSCLLIFSSTPHPPKCTRTPHKSSSPVPSSAEFPLKEMRCQHQAKVSGLKSVLLTKLPTGSSQTSIRSASRNSSRPTGPLFKALLNTYTRDSQTASDPSLPVYPPVRRRTPQASQPT